jgi:hypothetical protein
MSKRHIRYRVSRALIHFGIWLMPEGRYKSELLDVLWQLHDRVKATISEGRSI